MNFSQRIREPQQGMGLTAQWLNKLLESVFGRIRGGNGIRVNRIGQNLVVEAIGGVGGGRGGGGGEVIVVHTIGGLPEPAAATTIALVIDESLLYHRNGENSAWLPVSRWVDVS
jgi:hypothetical protein